MTLKEIKNKVLQEEYGFLRTNEHLGNNIILIGLGGSHAYGTNNENSDIDIRGIALNTKRELLTNQNFEQFVNESTDTTIYSFNKIISLLSNCNPNTVEILGLKPEHYLFVSPIGQELLDNKEMFLSRRAIGSFGGYASQQLYRLHQKETHEMEQKKLESHILGVMKIMEERFSDKYSAYPEDAIKLFIDKSDREDFDTEIFMDINLTHYPVRDYLAMWAELQQTAKQYNQIGKRNKHAIEHDKIGKHMCHLIRMYIMCLDILEKHEIVIYREKEHDLLMDIRNGKYVTENNEVIPEFYDMVHEYEVRFDYAKENTDLPSNPDYERINDFVMSVNERVVRGEI